MLLVDVIFQWSKAIISNLINRIPFLGFLLNDDYNVIIVDAHVLLAGLYYIEAVINCKFIGKYIALFVDYLVAKGLRLADLHVLGFSLGAHIAGYVGNYITSGRLPRITGNFMFYLLIFSNILHNKHKLN